MSLKETISIWNEAVTLFDAGKCDEAKEKFRVVPDQPAKILFNIGSLSLLTNNCDQALKNDGVDWVASLVSNCCQDSSCFSEAVVKDAFLAVAYFQRGCTNFKLKRYENAERDFESTLDKMRESDLIDYRQLGLSVKLYTSQVLINLAVVAHHLGDRDKACKLVQRASRLVRDSTLETTIAAALSSLPNLKLNLMEIPPQDSIFRPPKSVVANLQKKDFLGKAQVISSVAHNDSFVGFEGARKENAYKSPKEDVYSIDLKLLQCHSNPTSPTPSRRRNQLFVEDTVVRKGSLTPPPPTRPPPKPPSSIIKTFQTNSGNINSRLAVPPQLNGLGGSRSTEELRSNDEPRLIGRSRSRDDLLSNDSSRSTNGSRPPPPSYAPPVLAAKGVINKDKVKPQRPPPPVLQRRL